MSDLFDVRFFSVTDIIDDNDDEWAMERRKKAKIKMKLSPKKLMKNIKKDLKNKSKPKPEGEEPTAAPVVVGEAVEKVRREFVPPNSDSEEWKKFMEMQDRITQVLAKTTEKVGPNKLAYMNDVVSVSYLTQTRFEKCRCSSTRSKLYCIVLFCPFRIAEGPDTMDSS